MNIESNNLKTPSSVPYNQKKLVQIMRKPTLGHSSPIVTQVYSHITPEERVRSVNGLWSEKEEWSPPKPRGRTGRFTTETPRAQRSEAFDLSEGE